jgi:hypothetical protein
VRTSHKDTNHKLSHDDDSPASTMHVRLHTLVDNQTEPRKMHHFQRMQASCSTHTLLGRSSSKMKSTQPRRDHVPTSQPCLLVLLATTLITASCWSAVHAWTTTISTFAPRAPISTARQHLPSGTADRRRLVQLWSATEDSDEADNVDGEEELDIEALEQLRRGSTKVCVRFVE